MHLVEYQGQIYKAVTPIHGPMSRILFDPQARKFRAILPSIRVTTNDARALESFVEALGARRATLFKSLGFAIVEIPKDMHPLRAVAKLQTLPSRPEARLRTRGPRRQWR